MFVISVPASKISSCKLLIVRKKYKTCTDLADHATHVVRILFMSHFFLGLVLQDADGVGVGVFDTIFQFPCG